MAGLLSPSLGLTYRLVVEPSLGMAWVDLPVFGTEGPIHERGVVEREPGLYFVGLEFLYAMSSVMVHGAGRDAQHIADHIASRVPAG